MKQLIVALGPQRYRVERPFYRHDGPGIVSDVGVGPEGHVHVLIRHDPLAAEGGPAIVTLDGNGGLVAAWGGDDIADAHMLRIAPDGRIFVVDRDAHCLVVFEHRRSVATIGTRNAPLQPFNHPTGVAFMPDGAFAVSDGYANARVHCYDRDLQPVKSWGRHGRADGAFRTPHGVWCLPDGRIAVADRGNDRVQVFSRDGQHLLSLDGFVQPMAIWGDAAGRMFVTDAVPSLTLLGPDLEIIGRARPVTNGAHGISGTPDGTLYLAEPGQARVTRLAPLP